jgi:hypothetical protein
MLGLRASRVVRFSPIRSAIRPLIRRQFLHVRQPLRNAIKKEVAPQPPPKPSLKELTKKYGWSAVGVYFALSALDFPICFLFVHSLGQEKVKEIEKSVKGFFGFSTDPEDLATKDPSEGGDKKDEGSEWSTLITELTIAYAIHKSVFVFVRVPATAAITPWVVRKLQSYGFNIGRGGQAVGMGSTPAKRQRWGSWFF